MSLLRSLPEITERDRSCFGGKGYSLSIMAGNGMRIPEAICLSTEAYQDLFAFQSGEVLVCDAVDPNMTFVVPLASGIVERRGGMLVHGAIIAREYGLPCVTGVPDAISLVKTGNPITVDGFLGIVTVGASSHREK